MSQAKIHLWPLGTHHSPLSSSHWRSGGSISSSLSLSLSLSLSPEESSGTLVTFSLFAISMVKLKGIATHQLWESPTGFPAFVNVSIFQLKNHEVKSPITCKNVTKVPCSRVSQFLKGFKLFPVFHCSYWATVFMLWHSLANPSALKSSYFVVKKVAVFVLLFSGRCKVQKLKTAQKFY